MAIPEPIRSVQNPLEKAPWVGLPLGPEGRAGMKIGKRQIHNHWKQETEVPRTDPRAFISGVLYLQAGRGEMAQDQKKSPDLESTSRAENGQMAPNTHLNSSSDKSQIIFKHIFHATFKVYIKTFFYIYTHIYV